MKLKFLQLFARATHNKKGSLSLAALKMMYLYEKRQSGHFAELLCIATLRFTTRSAAAFGLKIFRSLIWFRRAYAVENPLPNL